ncbi:hypothetical protein [Muricoccus vinaceus]|uniref:Uncharacterized protein n=1 Tax=Muricoccus vinaceus TaxID=424704 RepID=A0ABV6IPK7_9PROT
MPPREDLLPKLRPRGEPRGAGPHAGERVQLREAPPGLNSCLFGGLGAGRRQQLRLEKQ